ncbi:phage major capsid protein [Clostridia bacterium]|nr:phage major capsid protein [Clostridia bacterium]
MLAAKKEARDAKVASAETIESVEELRSINGIVDALNVEIRDLEDMIAKLPEDAPTVERTAAVNGTTPGMVSAPIIERTAENGDMEYRKAFQQFITRGTPIAPELRTDASTKTSDVGSVIPTAIANRIIEKLEATGMILPLITKTSFASGVNIPTSSVKPVATWVSEGASSDKQKKTTSFISFSAFKLRCEISMSAEVGAMALAIFEDKFVSQVVEAMVKKIESTIFSGADGTTSPKGIFAETVVSGQNVDVAANGKLEYQTLVDAEAALPLAYESEALWHMTKKTFMGFIGMKDTAGQPIARVNYGISGAPERTLLGRGVVLNEYMDSYASTVVSDTIVAAIFNLKDYVLNTIYDMGVQKKQDWDTEDMLTKAVMSVDGKVVDKNSLVTVTKKA